jgi:hypothetical protein
VMILKRDEEDRSEEQSEDKVPHED